ncbi:MAG: sensor histidine kinase, partial [Candidatus Binatia bacterium]
MRNAKTYYRQYQELFDREVRYLRESQNYPQAEYKQEKETAADGVLQELEELRSYTQQKMYGKIKELAEAGDNARRIAMLMGAASLILVVMLSLLITRSITHPISILKSKTSEIAKGNFDVTLNLSSPPEIAELAAAFNLMCQRLNEVDTMKSEFFSSMSHELRTPLASIREGTGLLLDGLAGPITDKQKRILSIIVEESHRLIGLVNSLLDLSKMEAGMMTYTFDKSSLTPLIDGVITGIEPLAKAKRISLYAQLGEDLPSLRLDSEKVLQVLRNLLGNAVKFTPEGGHVRISAHNVDRGV